METFDIPLIEPYLGLKADEYVHECFTTKWISSRGHFIRDFEDLFASYIGTKHAVAVSNGTTALHLSLLSLGIGSGDEVIVPDLTFAATINAVLHANATPVIVDVDPETWNISPDALERAITPRTRAVIPVHLYGYPADVDAIMALARKHSLLVIEDSAEAHGATWNGKKMGGFGACGTFSFYGNKIITTGEGGMVTVNDTAVYEKMLVIRDHGMNKNNRYHYDVVGYNYRMTNPQAALGCAQMKEIDDILKHRRTIQRWYEDRLGSVLSVTLRKDRSPAASVNWLFTCLVNDRDGVIRRLADARIESRPMFYPLHDMEIYRSYRHGTYDASNRVSTRGISLPTYFEMTEAQVDKVCSVIAGSARR